MPPDISIIIPTFNRSSLLKTVLPTYLNQRVSLEVILVDDSTDSLDRDALKKLAASDNRIHLIQNAKKEGMTRSRNIGIRNSDGRFIFFGEDDVILPPDHLITLLAHQEKKTADIIGGRKIWLKDGESSEDGLQKANQMKGKRFDTFLMDFRSDLPGLKDVAAPFLQNNVLIRREVFQKVLFDEGYAGFTRGYPWREETDFS